MYVEVRPKHNSTMVSDASPGTNRSFIQRRCLPTVHAHRMVTSNVPIRPLLMVIRGQTVVWFCVGFWSWRTFDTRLARQKLGKNNTPRPWWPPSPYGRHGAPPPAPPHTTISQRGVRRVYVVKTKEYICYYCLLAI